MAFSKVRGPGITTDDNYRVGVITATKFIGEMESAGGDSTFQNVTIDGNLTVQGDTTTLNTTLRNVELLRVAANNGTATAGIITQTGTGDILNLFDGNTEVVSVVDGGNVGLGMTDPEALLHLKAANPQLVVMDTDTTEANTSATIRLANASAAGHTNHYFNIKKEGTDLVIDDGQIGSGVEERLRINSSGYVGINTTVMSNAERLAVQLGNDEMFELRSAAQELFQVWKESSTEETRLNIKHNGSTKIHLRGNGKSYFNGGNIGIGTDNPSADYRVTIKSSTSPSNALLLDTTESDYNTNLYFAKQGTNKWLIGNKATDDAFRIVSGSTEVLGIDTNGLIANNDRKPSNYGSPNLLISGTDSTLTLMGDGSTNSTSFTGIKFRVAGGSHGDYTKAGIFSRREGGYNDLSLIFALDTAADATSVSIADEKMRITSAGKVGIGTDNPDVLLHAEGNGSTGITFEGSSSNTNAIAGDAGTYLILKNKSVTDNNFSNILGVDAGGQATSQISFISKTQSTNAGELVFGTRLASGSMTERLRIDAIGEVKIGAGNSGTSMTEFGSGVGGLTLDDIGLLHTGLRLSHGSDDTYLVQGGNTNFYISQYGTGDMIFGVGASGNERLRIENDGHVRIQQTSTNAKLLLSRNESVPTHDTETGVIDFANNTGHTVNARIMAKTSGTGNVGGCLLVETRNEADSTLTEKLRIISTGKVGIGLTNPTYNLDVSGITRITNNAANTATDMNVSGALSLHNLQDAKGSFIDFIAESANGTAGMMAKIGGWNAHAGSGYSGELTFSTRNGSSMLERLRITSAGYVGIGTQLPNKTGIQNGVKVLEISGGDGGELIVGNHASVNVSAGMHVGSIAFKNNDSSTGSVPHYAGIRCKTTDTSGNMELRFYTGMNKFETDIPQVLIDNVGKVGINTTNPGSLLEFGVARSLQSYPPISFKGRWGNGLADAAISTTDDTGGVDIMMGSNVYMGTNGAFTRYKVEYGSAAVRCQYTGNTLFYNKSGNNAPVESMRIDGDGDVGIGTNNPGNNNERLIVRKDVAAASGSATIGIHNLHHTGSSSASSGQLNFIFKNYNASHSWWGGRILCYSSDNYNQYTYLRFDTAHQGNAAGKMWIISDGRVGIATANPQEKLTVDGSILATAGGNWTTYATKLTSRLDSTHMMSLQAYHNSSTAQEVLGTWADGGGGNMRVVLSSDKLPVGIGTVKPRGSSKCDIWNNDVGAGAVCLRLGATIYQQERESIRFGRTDHDPDIRYHSIKQYHDGVSSGANYLKFFIHNASNTTSQTETFKIAGNGKVYVKHGIDVSGSEGTGTHITSITHTGEGAFDGGLVMKTRGYEDYVFKWSGQKDHKVVLNGPSYLSAWITYQFTQTNSGTDTMNHISGKWANNYTTHTWVPDHDSGGASALADAGSGGGKPHIVASDQNDNTSGGSDNARLTISEEYAGGSLSMNNTVLCVRVFYASNTMSIAHTGSNP